MIYFAARRRNAVGGAGLAVCKKHHCRVPRGAQRHQGKISSGNFAPQRLFSKKVLAKCSIASHFLSSCAFTMPANTGLSVNIGDFSFKRQF